MGDGLLPISQSHAIYPTKGNELYYAAIVGSKFLSTIGIFLLFDTLRIFPLLYVCFFYAFWTFLVNFAFHKYSRTPLYPKLKHHQWILTGLYSAIEALISLIWLTGLLLCGPYRFVLIFKQPDAFLVAIAGALLFDSTKQGKRQGAAFFVLAICVILFFDHDSHRLAAEHPEGTHTSSVQHVLAWWLGLSDHKVGVILLAVAVVLHLVHASFGRRIALSAMVGGTGLGLAVGQQRLAYLSNAFQTIFLAPLALFAWGNSTDAVSWSSIIISLPVLFLVALFSSVLEYRAAEVAASRIGNLRATQVAVIANIVIGFILSFCCSCTFISVYSREDLASFTKYHELHHRPPEPSGDSEAIEAHHQISGGLLCALLLILYSLYQMTSSASAKGGRTGHFIGYSAANGMPMYVVSEQSGGMVQHKGSLLTSLNALFRSMLQHILEDAQSKRIFYYLCLNLSFSFVELLYGALSNSLGLISDGVHMLFDCSALVLGLFAAVMARSPPTRIFTYGFDRVELLSGYINALFLVVIALFIFATALRRLFAPPEIHSDRLLLVSILGLLVNLVGLFSLGGHAHSHGGGAHGHSHGGEHGHSHASEHGHSHADHKPKKHRVSSCEHEHEHEHAHEEACSHHVDGCVDEHHTSSTINMAGSSDPHDEDSHEFFEHNNANMRGVFLHVLADTLGSVGVIVSSFLIANLGWFWADPLVSLVLALMIGASAWPLLSDTASVLLLRSPPSYAERAEKLERKLQARVNGAVAVRRLRFWQHSATLHFAAVNIQVAENVDAQAAIQEAVAVLKKEGASRVVVQVEKDSLYDILALIQSTAASSARFLPFSASSSSLWTSSANH